MRKILLIHSLFLLVSSSLWSQNYIVSKKTYARNSFLDTFVMKYDLIQNYDKKICIDTFRSEFLEYSTAIGRTFLSNKSQYDETKRVSVREYHRIYWQKKSSSAFEQTGSERTREKYVYSLPNVKHDTAYIEFYDTAKVWKPYFTRLIAKSGFGIDTVFWEDYTMVVTNNKRQIITFAHIRPTKRAIDSVITFYDDKDRFIGKHTYLTHWNKLMLVIKDNRIYNGDKLSEVHTYTLQNIASSGNSDTLRTKTIYNYNAKGYLESEDRTNELTYALNSKSKLITKFRTIYTDYNAKGQNTIKKSETLIDSTKTWDLNSITKTYYLSDTLISRDTTFNYIKGQMTGNDRINIYEYDACESIVSSLEDIKQQGIEFKIFPNPTTGYFNLTLNTEGIESDNIFIQIFDLQGREVYQTKVNNNVNSIDISHLNKGFYLVKVADKTHSTVKKLVLN